MTPKPSLFLIFKAMVAYIIIKMQMMEGMNKYGSKCRAYMMVNKTRSAQSVVAAS
jgi:hypothetical protein